MELTCSDIPVVQALRLGLASLYSDYCCPPVCLFAVPVPSHIYEGGHSALGCTHRENKKHINIMCETDHFRNLGKYEGRIINLMREVGRNRLVEK